MQHIKQPITNLTENIVKAMASKTKFYRTNRNVFGHYFNSPEHYESLILAGNFARIGEIIKENSDFDLQEFINERK